MIQIGDAADNAKKCIEIAEEIGNEYLRLKASILYAMVRCYGWSKADYEYRNDLAEYFRQNNYDMDFAMLIALDYGTISYRNIKDDVNVRLIAEAMGGKGHDKAASSPIDENQKNQLVKILTKVK